MGRRNCENNDRRTEQYRKLFIGGLTPQTDEIRLKKYYEQWGELVDFVVMKDNKTGRSRGFGFVTYRDAAMVDEAQNNRPHEIDGKIVEAKRAMPREDSNTPESHMTVNKLFVGGLKKDVGKEQLRDYFGKFGSVVECEIVTWKDSGESRGFGFVTFDDYDPVDKAILYKPHQICSSRVDVKKALSKDEMEEIRRKQGSESSLVPSPGGSSAGPVGGLMVGGITGDYYSNSASSTMGPGTQTYHQFSSTEATTVAPPPSYSSMGSIIYDPSSFGAAGSYASLAWNPTSMMNGGFYYAPARPNPTELMVPQYPTSHNHQQQHQQQQQQQHNLGKNPLGTPTIISFPTSLINSESSEDTGLSKASITVVNSENLIPGPNSNNIAIF